MPPASTTPPAKRTLPAANKDRALRTRDPWSGGACVVDGRDSAGHPGLMHTETQRGRLWTTFGQRCLGTAKTVNRPPQQPAQPPIRQLLGAADAQTAHPATSSTPGAPTTGLRERGNNTSRSTGRSGRQNTATQRNMRREKRGTVQGPVKKQQPDGMSHGGGGVGTRPWWLALLACGGAYWPLAFEPSAMTSRHPHYCGHPHCCGHPPAWVGIQNAISAHGILP